MIKSILPKLHPHVFLAFVVVKLVSVGIVVGLRYRAKARARSTN